MCTHTSTCCYSKLRNKRTLHKAHLFNLPRTPPQCATCHLSRSSSPPEARLGKPFRMCQSGSWKQSNEVTCSNSLADHRLISPQDISEVTRPNGSSLFSSATGPATYATPSVLAESQHPTSCSASGMTQSQGYPWLCQGLGPLESRLAPG